MTVNSRPGCGRSSRRASWAGRAQVQGSQPLGPTLSPLQRGPQDPGGHMPSPPPPRRYALRAGDPGSPGTVHHHGDFQLLSQALRRQRWAGERGQCRAGGMEGGPAPRTQRCLLGLQFDSCVWMPNLPPSMQLPPPTSKGQTKPEGFLATLPPVNATCDIIIALWLLSKEPGDQVSAGGCGPGQASSGVCEGGLFPLSGPDPTLPPRRWDPSPH